MIKKLLCWLRHHPKKKVLSYGCWGAGTFYRDMECDECGSRWTENNYM